MSAAIKKTASVTIARGFQNAQENTGLSAFRPKRSFTLRPLLHSRIDPLAERAPRVATIVLNWNGWLDTVECLESLLRMDIPTHRIIVCDNGSADGSMARLEEWANGTIEVVTTHAEGGHSWAYRPVKKPIAFASYGSIDEAFRGPVNDARVLTFIQTGSNLGYGGGNNVGIRYAVERLGAQFLWILNNDTVTDAHALSNLLEHAQAHPDVAIVGSKLLQYSAPTRIQALGGGRFNPLFAHDTQIGRGRQTHPLSASELDLDHVVGASMLVRAGAIDDVGLLDESYFLYREETDWCIRMRNRGWRLSYCPTSVVWHKEGHRSGFKTALHDYYAVRNMLHLVYKFYPHAIVSAFAASLIRVILPKAGRFQLHRLLTASRAYTDFLRGIKGKTAVNPDALITQLRRHS